MQAKAWAVNIMREEHNKIGKNQGLELFANHEKGAVPVAWRAKLKSKQLYL